MGELGPEEMPDHTAVLTGACWCLQSASLPQLRRRMVCRVMKSHPLHFEVQRSRSYRLRATEVGSSWWWFYMREVRGKKEGK
jgi:hypothetical protein